jgi:hypothetical protein
MNKNFGEDAGNWLDTTRAPARKISPIYQEIVKPGETKEGEKEKENWPKEEPEEEAQI